MKTSKACGIIVISANHKMLILQNSIRGDWGVPKGHMEEGENERQTAFRELKEETGIKVESLKLDTLFNKELSYCFLKKTGQSILKKAFYFLARCDKQLTVSLSDEHQSYLWASQPVITQKIQYPDLRHMLLESFNG